MAGTNESAQAELLATLQKPDASYEQKAAACRELAHAGDRAAVPVLAAMLADEKLSHMARYALAPIPDPAVDKVLCESLEKLQGRLLAGVIETLGARRYSGAVEPLTGLLRHQEPQVACAAAGALGRIATLPAGKALRSALEQAKGEVLFAVGDGLLTCSDALAAKGDRKNALAFYDALTKVDMPLPLRLAATRGRILCAGSAGLKLLAQQLNAEDIHFFANAVGVAQEYPDRKIVPVLVEQLGKIPPARLPSLIQVLGKRGDASALPALLGLAKTGEKPVRLAAIAALAEIGKAGAAPALVEVLKDSDPQVARAASASLASLPGAEVDEAIAKLLECDDPALRIKAIDLAGQRKIKGALPVLERLMADKDESVRVAAIRNYGVLAGSAEFPALLDSLMKASNKAEATALEKVLASVCSLALDREACAASLVEALRKAPPASKPAVLRVLPAAGGQAALAAVRVATGDADPEIRQTGIRVLSEWKTADAVPVLLELAKTAGSENERLLGLRGYLGMAIRPDIPEQVRIDICRQAQSMISRNDERTMLLGAVGSIASAELLGLALPCLDKAESRESAVAAILAIAGKREKGRDGAAMREAVERAASVTENASQKELAAKLLKQLKAKGKA